MVTDTLSTMTNLDPASLASNKLTPADGSTPRLSGDAAARLAGGLDPAWRIEGDRLTREFGFPTFAAAFGLATRVALLAEAHDHHPTLEIAWGRLIVTWSTDAISGLSENDFVMAAKVDRVVARGLGIKD